VVNSVTYDALECVHGPFGENTNIGVMRIRVNLIQNVFRVSEAREMPSGVRKSVKRPAVVSKKCRPACFHIGGGRNHCSEPGFTYVKVLE
jgi:hypothetical protein